MRSLKCALAVGSQWREVDGAGGFQDAAEFDQARGHHAEVGHHVAVAKKIAEGLDDLGDLLRAVGHHLLVRLCRGLVPAPGVLEGPDLRGRPGAVVLGEQDVVVLVALERRVEVDEVNRLVLDIAPEDIEIVAVVQDVLSHDSSSHRRRRAANHYLSVGRGARPTLLRPRESPTYISSSVRTPDAQSRSTLIPPPTYQESLELTTTCRSAAPGRHDHYSPVSGRPSFYPLSPQSRVLVRA